MRMVICYRDSEGQELLAGPIESDKDFFVPSEGDVLLYNSWSYEVARREFKYEENKTGVTVYCERERQNR